MQSSIILSDKFSLVNNLAFDNFTVYKIIIHLLRMFTAYKFINPFVTSFLQQPKSLNFS